MGWSHVKHFPRKNNEQCYLVAIELDLVSCDIVKSFLNILLCDDYDWSVTAEVIVILGRPP